MTDHRPWLASYPSDVPHTLEPYPEASVFSMLERSASVWPENTAIAFLGKHLSYRELLRDVERFSAVLALLGVGRDDRVGLLLPNCPQYVIAYYATVRLGAVVVGNNPLYTKRELSHQLADAGIKVMVVLDQLYPAFAETQQETVASVIATKLTDYLPFPLNLLAPLKFRRDAREEGHPWPAVPSEAPVKWWAPLMKGAGTPPRAPDIDPSRDTAGLVYTGGTTGLSKGAMLSHRNIVANCMQSAAWFSDLKDGEDAIMCVLPFFHSYGMTVGMNLGIYRAGKLILVPRFELKRVLQQVQKEKPTIFPGVPRLYVAINDAEETKKYDLHSIKACLSGAASLSKSVAERFASITSGRLVEGYGITEASPVTHANPIYGKAKTGSIGLPITDTECRILDLEDPDRVVGVGEPGELLIRGPQIMQGYWKRPEDTALTIRGGWLYTGDVATMDEEGYFAIVDRIKDMIIVSGFNVYPAEVESVLARHPAIAKVAVVGVPDDTTGEAVKAFVVLREGAQATAEEVTSWSRDPENGLTGYRVPKQVEFRDSLPETLVGKVLRRVLLEQERERSAAPSSST
ncbi:MAG: long-chain-fatty-acid--CoA ligase [Actinomycetota bacterium]